jgi:predicted nuclease with TOPRIM domain
MSVDERRRLELADAAKRMLGDDAGLTLMELLPPVGWADVATRHDVLVLRGDLDLLREDFGRLRGEFNGLRGEFNDLRGEFDDLRGEFDGLRGEFNGLRGEFDDLRGEFDELRNDFKDLRRDVNVRLEQGFRQILVTMTTLVISGFLVGVLAIVATIVAVALVR